MARLDIFRMGTKSKAVCGGWGIGGGWVGKCYLIPVSHNRGREGKCYSIPVSHNRGRKGIT